MNEKDYKYIGNLIINKELLKLEYFNQNKCLTCVNKIICNKKNKTNCKHYNSDIEYRYSIIVGYIKYLTIIRKKGLIKQFQKIYDIYKRRSC